MCDKIVVVAKDRIFVWFEGASFFNQGEEYVYRPSEEGQLNDHQLSIQERFKYIPDVQLSVRNDDGETNIVVISKGSPIVRNEKSIICNNQIVITPAGEMKRESRSQFVFETKRGPKFVDITFSNPSQLPLYTILSTLNDEEHSQLTKLVNTGPARMALLRMIQQKGNFFRNQGDQLKADRYHNDETVLEIGYENNQIYTKDYRVRK